MFADGTTICQECNRRVPAQVACILCGHEAESLLQATPVESGSGTGLDGDSQGSYAADYAFA